MHRECIILICAMTICARSELVKGEINLEHYLSLGSALRAL